MLVCLKIICFWCVLEFVYINTLVVPILPSRCSTAPRANSFCIMDLSLFCQLKKTVMFINQPGASVVQSIVSLMSSFCLSKSLLYNQIMQELNFFQEKYWCICKREKTKAHVSCTIVQADKLLCYSKPREYNLF